MESIIEFLMKVSALKRMPRTGRKIVGIPEAESIADHSYRLALMTLLIASLLEARGVKIDKLKALRMALIHDIPEVLIGDIPRPSLEAKLVEARDLEAFRSLIKDLPEEIRKTLEEDYREFLEANTIEAKLVRSLDKLEASLQAVEYYRIFKAKRLKKFADVSVEMLQEMKDLILSLLEEDDRSL